MRRPLWQYIGAATVAVIGIALVYGAYRAGLTCSTPAKRTAMKITEANGCAEFWIHRYQSAWSQIIAAGVAIFAAGLAWRAVQAQIAAQNRATRISEMAFWESKKEISETALITLSRMRTNLNGLHYAREARKDGQNINVGACQLMRAAGHYPFAEIDSSSVGPEGAPYAEFVDKLAGQIARLDSGPSHDMIVTIDRALSGLFDLLPFVFDGIESARERHDRQVVRAGDALENL